MGDSISSSYDDEKKYEAICVSRGIKPLYTFEHEWWVEHSLPRFKDSIHYIDISWEEYNKKTKLNSVCSKIERLEKLIDVYKDVEEKLKNNEDVKLPLPQMI